MHATEDMSLVNFFVSQHLGPYPRSLDCENLGMHAGRSGAPIHPKVRFHA